MEAWQAERAELLELFGAAVASAEQAREQAATWCRQASALSAQIVELSSNVGMPTARTSESALHKLEPIAQEEDVLARHFDDVQAQVTALEKTVVELRGINDLLSREAKGDVEAALALARRAVEEAKRRVGSAQKEIDSAGNDATKCATIERDLVDVVSSVSVFAQQHVRGKLQTAIAECARSGPGGDAMWSSRLKRNVPAIGKLVDQTVDHLARVEAVLLKNEEELVATDKKTRFVEEEQQLIHDLCQLKQRFRDQFENVALPADENDAIKLLDSKNKDIDALGHIVETLTSSAHSEWDDEWRMSHRNLAVADQVAQLLQESFIFRKRMNQQEMERLSAGKKKDDKGGFRFFGR